MSAPDQTAAVGHVTRNADTLTIPAYLKHAPLDLTGQSLHVACVLMWDNKRDVAEGVKNNTANALYTRLQQELH